MDDPFQLIQNIHHSHLPADVLIYIHFDKAIHDINETVVLKKRLIVLVHAYLKHYDLTADQVRYVKSCLQESHSET